MLRRRLFSLRRTLRQQNTRSSSSTKVPKEDEHVVGTKECGSSGTFTSGNRRHLSLYVSFLLIVLLYVSQVEQVDLWWVNENSDHVRSCDGDGFCSFGQVCGLWSSSAVQCVRYDDIEQQDSNLRTATKKQKLCLESCQKELLLNELFQYASNPVLLRSVSYSMTTKAQSCLLQFERLRGSGKDLRESYNATEWKKTRFQWIRRIDPVPVPDNLTAQGGQYPLPPPRDKAVFQAFCEAPRRRRKPKIKYNVTISSGADSSYFEALGNLAASLKYWSPQLRIVVYNLGMLDYQIQQVVQWTNVQALVNWTDNQSEYPKHVYENLKNYAWKSLIIQEASQTYESMLWLDAGVTIVGPLDPILEVLYRDGIFLVQGQDTDMTRLSHDDTYRWHGCKKEDYQGLPHYAGGIQGHVRTSRYISTIVDPNAACALDKNCIAPSKSSTQNHRFDQSSLSILAHRYRIPSYTEFLAASREQLATNLTESSAPFILWTSRLAGSRSFYTDTTLSLSLELDDDYD